MGKGVTYIISSDAIEWRQHLAQLSVDRKIIFEKSIGFYSTRELCGQSGRLLLAKLVPAFRVEDIA
jgi:hypothetical protein